MRSPVHVGSEVLVWEMAVRIGAAFVLGCVAAGIYRLTIRNKNANESFLATLVLLR